MEILSGKVLTTPPVTSLGCVAVMSQAKRRQLGNRAIWRFSTEMSYIPQADTFSDVEGNMWVYRYGEISHIAAVSKSRSCYTMISSQLWESLCPPYVV